jgi:hypothetical protein
VRAMNDTRRASRRTVLTLAAAALAALCAAVVGATAGAKSPAQRFFTSPSRNIECELDNGGGIGQLAYCESINEPRSVRLSSTGSLKICNGTKCLSDGPEQDPILPYGHSVTFGPFHCVSLTSGMKCTLRSTGHGFEISRTAVVRVT